MCVCVCIYLPRTNEVFSRGGLCQSGEGGPAILSCCHIKSVPLSVGEREPGRGEGETGGRCEGRRAKKRGKVACAGVEKSM